VPKSVCLALVALALAVLQSGALAAAPAPRGEAHSKVQRRARRAKIDVPAARAPRSGALPKKVERKAEAKPTPPVPRAESVGSPNEGRLQGGVHLDLSHPYLRVIPAYARGDVRWGLPGLVNLIDRAARAVYKRYPGSVLNLGDISRKGGGDVLRHHSHESGRDADLGFYAVDARGKQIHGRTFIQFDPSGESPNLPGARFDLDRNWLLVQEMLTDPGARVSHIFISEPLRQRLLAHARARGVSRALLDRAAVAMMQPTSALPHDDHMHVRISCPASMRGSCVELARNAPHGRGRVAHKGHRVLYTPGKAAPARADPAVARGKRPLPSAEPRLKPRPPAAAGVELGDAFTLDLPEEDDAEADGAEVKDASDASGALKIAD
jgi:penicillin-insensitive murein endopeptidase